MPDEVSETPDESVIPGPTPTSLEAAYSRPWICSKCGETVDAGFQVCWSCGTSIDGVEDPSFELARESAAGDDRSRATDLIDDDRADLNPESGPLFCFRCEGPLEPGFIADYQHGLTMHPGEWVAGNPRPTFWTGTWTGGRRYPIKAFRCRRCGRLEFWTGEPREED